MLQFKDKAHAVQFLENRKDLCLHPSKKTYTHKGDYLLKDGEFAKPEYKPTRYKDGWGIKKIHKFYGSALRKPKDGRCFLASGKLVVKGSL